MDTKDIKFRSIKYGNKRILVGICKLKNFNWYAGKFNNYYVLIFNIDLNIKLRSKLLHKMIRSYY